MRRDSSGRLMLTQDVASLCGVSGATVRAWAAKGWLVPDRVTRGGVGVYYADSVEDFHRRRQGYAAAAPRLKEAYGLAPIDQLEISLPEFRSMPESTVE